jgi:hypothetical protein
MQGFSFYHRRAAFRPPRHDKQRHAQELAGAFAARQRRVRSGLNPRSLIPWLTENTAASLDDHVRNRLQAE